MYVIVVNMEIHVEGEIDTIDTSNAFEERVV